MCTEHRELQKQEAARDVTILRDDEELGDYSDAVHGRRLCQCAQSIPIFIYLLSTEYYFLQEHSLFSSTTVPYKDVSTTVPFPTLPYEFLLKRMKMMADAMLIMQQLLSANMILTPYLVLAYSSALRQLIEPRQRGERDLVENRRQIIPGFIDFLTASNGTHVFQRGHNRGEPQTGNEQ